MARYYEILQTHVVVVFVCFWVGLFFGTLKKKNYCPQIKGNVKVVKPMFVEKGLTRHNNYSRFNTIAHLKRTIIIKSRD